MKTFVRLAVAGALIMGTQAAFAQSLPSTNSSDLWLFVSDQAAGTTFAEDTGISISSLLPTAGDTANANISTDPVPNASSAAGSINVAASSALTAYISAANTAGQTLEWAVLGAQYNGTVTNTGFKKPGSDIVIAGASATPGNVSNVSQYQLGSLEQTAGSFNGDLTYLATSYTAGGKSYSFSSGTSTVNVWGNNSNATGNVGGSTDLYDASILQAGIGLGQAVSLYGMTGNNSTTSTQSYDLNDTLTLSANGTLAVAPVPVPAAVWLFGSGLLGLLGVGRRRAA